MDQSQQELRRAAAKAFMESLEQLEQSLQDSNSSATVRPSIQPPSATPAPPPQATLPPSPVSSPIDLQALEEAAADIEQYMQERERGE